MNKYLLYGLPIFASALLGAFALGYNAASTKAELAHEKFKAELYAASKESEANWQRRIEDAENALIVARKSESSARADTDRMRHQVATLSARAKTAEAQWGARCADLAVRQKELIDRASTAIEWCARVME